MPKLRNAQEAFTATMLAMIEALEMLNPPAGHALAEWTLRVTQTEKTVASFSTNYEPGVLLQVGLKFEDDLGMYFTKNLASNA